MKKRNALIFVIAGLSLLSSCGKPIYASTEEFSLPSETSQEEESVPSSSSISSSKKQSKWGGEVGEAIIDSFGWDIPFIENDGVTCKTGIDAFKDPYMFIYVEFDGYEEDPELINNKMAEYANICVKKGYTVTYETASYMDENYVVYQYPVYYADIEKSEEVGFELQIVEGAVNGKEMMGIYAITYPLYDENSWPSNMVKKVIGTDVPHLEGEGYRYYAQLNTFSDDGTPYCYLYAYGCYEEEIEAYVKTLRDASYMVYEYEDDYGSTYYMATDSKFKKMILFGFDYDNYTGSYFYIYKNSQTPFQ